MASHPGRQQHSHCCDKDIETKQRWSGWNLNFLVEGSCIESLQVCWVFWQKRVFFFLFWGYRRDNALVSMSGKKKRNFSYHPSTIQQAVRLSVKQWTWHISTSVLPRENNYKILITQKCLMRMTLVLQFFRQVLHKYCAALGFDITSCGKSLPTFRDNLFISWLNRAKIIFFCIHKAFVFACVCTQAIGAGLWNFVLSDTVPMETIFFTKLQRWQLNVPSEG